MNIPADLLPLAWHYIANASYLLLVLLAATTARWAALRDREAQHVYLGAIVVVLVLWNLHGGIQPGLEFHLLGVTALCLMFDWQFALFAASSVLAAGTWHAGSGWLAFGVNALVMVAVPLLLTRSLLYFCQRRLPHNFFIYIFINAFLAGALSVLLAGLASAALQRLAGAHSASELVNNFLAILPMLMFGEGFMNGAALSLAVAWRPGWVATFHDRWYLRGK